MRDDKGRFVKGHKQWVGKERSAETKEKIRLSLSGRHTSPATEFKKGCNKNYNILEEYYKTHQVWNKGTSGIVKHNSGSFNVLGGRKTPKGEKHWNWKGGTSPLRKNIQALQQYKDWRKRVFERDNFTCQECNKVGRRIHAHHIFPFYKIIERYKIKNIEDALKCKILWDISNGKTLCISCHKQTDSYLVNQFKN